MKFFEMIWKFINSKFFGYAIVILIGIFLASQCKRNEDLKREKIKLEQNLSAANDSMRIYENRQGELVAEKSVWILTERELRDQNRELYDQVRSQSGTVISLNNVVFGLRQDKSILQDSIKYLQSFAGEPQQISPTDWKMDWKLRYDWDNINYDYFEGHTNIRIDPVVGIDTLDFTVSHLGTLLDDRESRIGLTFGEQVIDGKLNVYVTTKYPGLTPESLEGVFIDPNTNRYIQSLITKRRWFTGFGVGPQLGLGIGPQLGSESNDFKLKPAVYLGIGIQYNIYQF